MFEVIYADINNNRIDCLTGVDFIPRIGELVLFSYDKTQYYQVCNIMYPLFDNKNNKQTVIITCKKV